MKKNVLKAMSVGLSAVTIASTLSVPVYADEPAPVTEPAPATSEQPEIPEAGKDVADSACHPSEMMLISGQKDLRKYLIRFRMLLRQQMRIISQMIHLKMVQKPGKNGNSSQAGGHIGKRKM